ncbi:MAG: hypothetical protein KDC75_17870 [Phaeodactylibacter sp.]|nr:hypothetical protein [Phaeodactylibacter sp.]
MKKNRGRIFGDFVWLHAAAFTLFFLTFASPVEAQPYIKCATALWPGNAGNTLQAQITPPTIAWENTIEGSGHEIPESVQPTTDGGYILGGKYGSNASADITGATGKNFLPEPIFQYHLLQAHSQLELPAKRHLQCTHLNHQRRCSAGV